MEGRPHLFSSSVAFVGAEHVTRMARLVVIGDHLDRDTLQGELQTALNRGWVVSATDYQPNDTYVIGRVAAADVIDAPS